MIIQQICQYICSIGRFTNKIQIGQFKMRKVFHEAKAVVDSYQQIIQRQSIAKLQSVKKLHNLIFRESLLRMHLQLAISNSPQTLAGRSISDLLDLLNVGLHEPVPFTFYPLVGSPLNSIFCEMMQTQNGRTLFSNPQFNSSIREILRDYNQMLKSQASLKYVNEEPPFGWMCPQAQKHINYADFQCDKSKPHYGFRSWNDFFTRKLKQGARPIFGEGTVNASNIITHSCQAFPLQNPQMPVRNIKKIDRFWLKDQGYSLRDIFGGSRAEGELYSCLFQGGTIYQGFLDVFYYHCWHSPVDGQVQANYLIEGHYFVDKSQFTVRELDSFKVCQSYLSSVATRRIIVINADNHRIGKVALVYIGMADISSCVSHLQKGQRVAKGQYLGQFQIGGSSHAIIFQSQAKLKFNQSLYHSNNKSKLQKVNSFLAQLL